MSREQIIKNIKSWMQADEEIKQLQKVIKEKKELKKEAADVLINVMKENDLDSFDLKEGKLVHAQRKTKQSISKKFLQDTLAGYFKEDSKAEEMTNYILEQRQERVKDELKRKNK